MTLLATAAKRPSGHRNYELLQPDIVLDTAGSTGPIDSPTRIVRNEGDDVHGFVIHIVSDEFFALEFRTTWGEFDTDPGGIPEPYQYGTLIFCDTTTCVAYEYLGEAKGGMGALTRTQELNGPILAGMGVFMRARLGIGTCRLELMRMRGGRF